MAKWLKGNSLDLDINNYFLLLIRIGERNQVSLCSGRSWLVWPCSGICNWLYAWLVKSENNWYISYFSPSLFKELAVHLWTSYTVLTYTRIFNRYSHWNNKCWAISSCQSTERLETSWQIVLTKELQRRLFHRSQGNLNCFYWPKW